MVTHRRKKRSNRRKRTTRRRRHSYKRIFIGGEGEEKCIFVPICGGLGNQMYVYAAGITVKNKLKNIPMCILPTGNDHSATDYRKILFKQGIPVEHADVQSRMNAATKTLEFVKNPHNNWDNSQITTNDTKNILLAGGFFQNYNSIKSAIPIIRKDYKEVFAERYPGFHDTIKPTSAFMHVRKGDYGGASLGREYYDRALPMLDGINEITDIYIISDDITWCKEQGWSSPKIRWFDNPDDMKDELKTMYLMSLCLAGACISASTFSSWGVILGPDQNEASTIIYPKVWITGNSSRIKFPERWKAI